MATVDELIAKAKPREVTAPVCMAGDLNAEHEDLTRQLEAVSGNPMDADASISDKPARLHLAEQVAALEERMAGSLHTFVFRALSPAKFRELKRAHPPRADVVPAERIFNTETLPTALIAACCIDPEFPSTTKVDELFDRLGQGAFDQVFDAAWSACTGEATVPKSLLASVTMRTSVRR